ncbi:hypothetical protein Amsp01_044190 [Amycolatopsis sp. NBRC 101858]|uniref:hypothetical protein n=1 Tax=Amycolatopsis sp. NBRC 101858 TaxID=3032200 RepID=UPI0024A16869|nr:hypothetical protein [Amycolatopsis sp. NBRC 101858]GLY38395.1 hypothetical protein Amsp01_044190 [Amycolatopsis sp. NBRC 101858]
MTANQPGGSVLTILGSPRMAVYLAACQYDPDAALDLYAWNSLASASFWETMSHLEVALRNTMATRLEREHRRKNRTGSWLDDHHYILDRQAREDIKKARRRVENKHKMPSDGQTITELSFGFWRFLLANQYQTSLWPSLARGFPYAPDKRLSTVAGPVSRLHDFRNRIAHHEPIWNKELRDRMHDAYQLLTYIDPDLHSWVTKRCRIPPVLQTCPIVRPYP